MRTTVFFYGGLINPTVMEKVGLVADRKEIVTLGGFALDVAPYFNLTPSPIESVFGLLMDVEHDALARAYSQLATTYYPNAVITQDSRGQLRPALCYLAENITPAPAEATYVHRLLDTAEELGFPDWYLAKIRAFLPQQ